jgi:hypothetical protein
MIALTLLNASHLRLVALGYMRAQAGEPLLLLVWLSVGICVIPLLCCFLEHRLRVKEEKKG